jgi:hypothetical protein
VVSGRRVGRVGSDAARLLSAQGVCLRLCLPPLGWFLDSGWQMVRPKATLTKVGWMRNWFNLWLSRPWIGNYDLLLTTSSLTQLFFESFHGDSPCRKLLVISQSF